MIDYAKREFQGGRLPPARAWLITALCVSAFFAVLYVVGEHDAKIERVGPLTTAGRAPVLVHHRHLLVDLDRICPPQGEHDSARVVMLIRSTADDSPTVESCFRAGARPAKRSTR